MLNPRLKPFAHLPATTALSARRLHPSPQKDTVMTSSKHATSAIKPKAAPATATEKLSRFAHLAGAAPVKWTKQGIWSEPADADSYASTAEVLAMARRVAPELFVPEK